MRLTKWYADCVDERGDVCIAYWMRIAWGPFAIRFASELLLRDGVLTERSARTRAEVPQWDGATLTWSMPEVTVTMERSAPPVSATFLDGAIRWHAFAPSAEATITTRDAIVRGRGYAERIDIDLAPWRLPIDELRWGRFTGARTSIVWIDWRGAHPLTFVGCNGESMAEAEVSDTGVRFGASTLMMTDTRVIRDASLRKTIGNVPLLRVLVPRSFQSMQERKWRSRGVFRGGAVTDEGWCIHEVVRFR